MDLPKIRNLDNTFLIKKIDEHNYGSKLPFFKLTFRLGLLKDGNGER